MSIHEVTYYQVKCDCCGRIETNYGDYSAWAHPDEARAEAPGWAEISEGEDLCPECWQDPDNDAESDDPVRKPGPHPHTTEES